MTEKSKTILKHSWIGVAVLAFVYFPVFQNEWMPKNVFTGNRDAVNSNQKDGLLPDLAPLPARDLVIERNGNDILLRFTTFYYNLGEGPLEFLGEGLQNESLQGDAEYTVLQRVYMKDGSYRDERVGTFLWHGEHAHYHFSDFVIYELKAVEAAGNTASSARVKATFCVRDIARTSLKSPAPREQGTYTSCSNNRQGISPGWADVYYNYYADQWLVITGVPSGTYLLSFILNPDGLFEEKTLENNTSSVLVDINIENLTVTALNAEPENAPNILEE